MNSFFAENFSAIIAQLLRKVGLYWDNQVIKMRFFQSDQKQFFKSVLLDIFILIESSEIHSLFCIIDETIFKSSRCRIVKSEKLAKGFTCILRSRGSRLLLPIYEY